MTNVVTPAEHANTTARRCRTTKTSWTDASCAGAVRATWRAGGRPVRGPLVPTRSLWVAADNVQVWIVCLRPLWCFVRPLQRCWPFSKYLQWLFFSLIKKVEKPVLHSTVICSSYARTWLQRCSVRLLKPVTSRTSASWLYRVRPHVRQRSKQLRSASCTIVRTCPQTIPIHLSEKTGHSERSYAKCFRLFFSSSLTAYVKKNQSLFEQNPRS